MGKLWTQSKTIWFNGIAAIPLIVDLITQFMTDGGLDLLPSEWATALQIVVLVGNVYLRTKTTQPVRRRA